MMRSQLMDATASVSRSFWPKAATAAIVTNSVVGPLYAQRLAACLKGGYPSIRILELPDGEAHKDWASLNLIFDDLLGAEVTYVSGREDRDPLERVEALQEVVDLHVRVAIDARLHLGALGEQRVGLVEPEQHLAIFGGFETTHRETNRGVRARLVPLNVRLLGNLDGWMQFIMAGIIVILVARALGGSRSRAVGRCSRGRRCRRARSARARAGARRSCTRSRRARRETLRGCSLPGIRL